MRHAVKLWRKPSKMKNIMRSILSLILLCLIPACDGVMVDRPFGGKPSTITGEEWNGHWYFDDDEIYRVSVIDAEEGVLEIGSIGDSDEGLIIEKSRAYLRESGGWKFLFIPGADEEDGYTWYKYENYEGEMIMLWLPSPDRFKEAVEKGLLQGEVRTKNVNGPASDPIGKIKYTTIMLENIGNDELELIKSEDQGIYFEWKNPIPILRVRK